MSRRGTLNALRKQQTLARARGNKVRQVMQPMPSGGLNLRDSNAMMPETDAERFTNVIYGPDGLRARKAPLAYASISASVEPGTLMTYKAPDGTEAFYAVAGGKVWDVSSTGPQTTPTSVTGLGSDLVSWANVAGKLIFANGVDAPQHWDGTNWSVEPLSVAMGEPALSVDKLSLVYPFKGRVYYGERDKLGFWYTVLDSTFDELRYFDLSYVSREGGSLLTITRYTVDGGSGPDDYPVFITTRGEAIVYQGTSPDAAATWALVGVYNIGEQSVVGTAPQTQQLAVEVGAQTILMTKNDYITLPGALAQGGINPPTKLSNPGGNAQWGVLGGWQAIRYDNGPYAVFNLPQGVTSDRLRYKQHVINLQTGAASEFANLDAKTWGTYNNKLYYAAYSSVAGESVVVHEALATATPVSVEVLSGPSKLRYAGNKMLQRLRVIVSASTSAGEVVFASVAGFTNQIPRVQLRFNYSTPLSDALDSNFLHTNEWVLQTGVGTVVQYRIFGALDATTEIKGIEIMYQPSGTMVFARS